MLALLGQMQHHSAHTKNRRGRPSKISKGWRPEDKPAWMFYRACLVLAVFERARMGGATREDAALWWPKLAAEVLAGRMGGATRKDAATAAINEWKNRHPLRKLSSTEIDNILRYYQPEKTPRVSLRVVEQDVLVEWEIVDGEFQLTGRWETRRVLTMRYAERPRYPKRGCGKRVAMQYSKKYLKKRLP